ncbi:YybH family protein [Chryseobacterium shigense]|uniref:Uncharacterized protein (TIGR02246 family) n=1 Tax=Chryseobacterium shigense TaxID=297244 RepID=A0A841N606_9FLAO|nr:nuclear transport factor 2 family protein [Chryseobacterium shigense]MBB6370141.1 uncharacterized protein (TIGR02246 family) [Chryseobacterium shigense]
MAKILIMMQALAVLTACTEKQQNIKNNNSTVTVQNNTTMEITAKKDIEETLFAYEKALNSSSTEQVLPLYTHNGIFMPQGGPSAEGQEQLKGAYDFVFKTLQLNVKFRIDEITLINESYAIARTVSQGTQIIHAEQKTTPEENRELFVMQKESGKWKIARYMFNKMK